MSRDNDLSKLEFIKRAIKHLREPPNKGIHNKYSGFNDAFREYFGKDPLEALKRFEAQRKVVKQPVKDGLMLYLPEDTPEKTNPQRIIEKIISSDTDERPSLKKAPSNNKQSSKEEVPIVVDEEGAHEATEHALISGPNRVWLEGFAQNKGKIKLKSVIVSRADVESMDRTKIELSWNRKSESWKINVGSLAYVIDHFVSLGYEIAVSPSLSHLVLEELPLEVEYLKVEQEEAGPTYENFQTEERSSSKSEKKDIRYKVKEPTTKYPDDEEFINKARVGIEKSMSKLTPIDVMNIWNRLESGENCESVSKDYPVSSGTINEIRNKNNWSWLTDPIQIDNKEKYKGILATLNYLILFKEKEEGIDEEVLQKALKRVDLYDTKLSPLDVINIRERLQLGDDPDYIAEDYPVGPGAIKNIKNGSNWSWLTDKLSGGNSRKYKRFIKAKLIEEGKSLEGANFEKYKTLDKKFVKRAWEKLRVNSTEFPPEKVIDIWEEFESGKKFGEIASEYKVDWEQVKNICLKDTFAWLTKKLGESDNEKYEGMFTALKYSKLKEGRDNVSGERGETENEYQSLSKAESRTNRNSQNSGDDSEPAKDRLEKEGEGEEVKEESKKQESESKSESWGEDQIERVWNCKKLKSIDISREIKMGIFDYLLSKARTNRANTMDQANRAGEVQENPFLSRKSVNYENQNRNRIKLLEKLLYKDEKTEKQEEEEEIKTEGKKEKNKVRKAKFKLQTDTASRFYEKGRQTLQRRVLRELLNIQDLDLEEKKCYEIIESRGRERIDFSLEGPNSSPRGYFWERLESRVVQLEPNSFRKKVRIINEAKKSNTINSGSNRKSTVRNYFRSIGPDIFSAEEERKVACKVREGDKEAREKFIEHNLRLSISIAKQYRWSNMAFEDLIQEGNEGLMKAVDRFDPRKGNKFSTYATYWIRQKIIRAVKNDRLIRIPAHIQEIQSKIDKFKNDSHSDEKVDKKEMANELDTSVSNVNRAIEHDESIIELGNKLQINYPDEIGTKLGKRRFFEVRRMSKKKLKMPLYNRKKHFGIGIRLEVPYEEAIKDLKSRVERRQIWEACKGELKSQLRKELSSREYRILILRYGFEYEEKTLEEVGKVFDLSRERIRQLQSRALEGLEDVSAMRKLNGFKLDCDLHEPIERYEMSEPWPEAMDDQEI